MKLRQLIAAVSLTAISGVVLADASDVNGVLASTNENQAFSGSACVTTIDAHHSYNSAFRHNMLASAVGDSKLQASCAFQSLKTAGLEAERSIFDTKEKPEFIETKVARFTLVNDKSLSHKKTVLQASVTSDLEVAEFARFTAIDEAKGLSKTNLQAAVTR